MPEAPTPKDRVTSLDTLAIARELRSLDRARIDKVFDLPSAGWSFALRAPGVGRRELLVVPGRYAALLSADVGHHEELGPFARDLRRLLTGGVLGSITDPGGERLLELEVRRSEGSYLVALEFFGSGNLLVGRDGRLVAVASPKSWAHRTLRIGSPYQRPPARLDPWTLDVPAIAESLRSSRTDRISTLAARLAFGGPLAEEVLARAGVAGEVSAPRDPDPTAEALHRAIQSLLTEIGSSPRGHLYLRGDVAVDAEPFAAVRWEGQPEVLDVETATFSEAAHRYFAPLGPIEPRAARPADDPLADLVRQRARQVDAIASLRAEAEERIAQGQSIYTHYNEAEAALAAASESAEPIIELEVEGLRVPLRRGESVPRSAQLLFEEAKRSQAKLAGAVAALAETEARMASVAAKARPTGGPRVVGAERRARRPAWFERHRWFLSSESILVIGGKDAPSNDLIVRRYLNAGDRYVHADIHGAASVIVKHPAPGEPAPTDVTMREAGQWAVSFSKAWRAGLAASDAFWVEHDQVSKAATSGEFVPRGAWVIHGTKQQMKDLPTELGVGTMTYDGEERWSVAPPSALRARGQLRFLLTPGPERERSAREVELSRELGLSRARLQPMLPAGGLTVRRA